MQSVEYIYMCVHISIIHPLCSINPQIPGVSNGKCEVESAEDAVAGDVAESLRGLSPGGGSGQLRSFSRLDSSPSNTLLKQEGLQLAEASFGDIPFNQV